MNRTANVIVSVFYFTFLALFFPTLQDASVNAVTAGNYTGAEATLVGNLPLLIVLLSVVVFGMVLFKGDVD